MDAAAEPFATLPFEEQVAVIDRIARATRDAPDGGDAVALLAEAGALPDAEPLARLLAALTAAGPVAPPVAAAASRLFAALPDAALLHLVSAPAQTPTLDALLADLVEGALTTWPLARISALAVLSRWLRRRAPDRWDRLVALAHAHLADRAHDPRWLLFASGPELADRARDPDRAADVRAVVASALDALARAPKSISQAHAETLLARRVYADAGHFLFELLQNADDARATRLAAEIATDRVVVTHDGVPLSLHDLVGLLSIGQTTKRAEQIGFFGVGFKSVYEICDRPRVHSGAFDFEIAHVSIPRAIGRRPPAADAGDTVFVLPYLDGPDDRVDPELLHRRALAIPPETLLTLPNLRAIEVVGPRGDHRRWVDAPDPHVPEGDARVLTRLESGAAVEARRYLVTDGLLRFDGPREEGRASDSPVRVAVALDAHGEPGPPPGPTLFAFLPTAQHTGLRALVHARFDVTLDRERLAQGSPWNDALLAEAGRVLARAALRLVAAGRAPLAVLPAPGELVPVVAPLAATLVHALADALCLPAADGALIAPARARLVEPRLAAALAGLDLGAGDRALAPLDAREQGVAALLGARPFSPADLVAFLTAALAPGAPPPPWLGAPVLDALAHAPVDDAALRALPLLTDSAGRLVPAAAAWAASAPWATLYAGIRPLVAPAAVAALPPELARRLALAPWSPTLALADLRDEARRPPLIARAGALFDALATLDAAALAALADVPLLPDTRGELRAVSAGLWRLDAALEPLSALVAARVPLVDPALAARHPSLVARWLPSWGMPDLAELASSAPWERVEADALAAVLDAEAAHLSAALCGRFARAPLFADRAAPIRQRRPLVGPDRGLVPAEPDLSALLPSWPWLAAPDRPFVRAASASAVGAVDVAAALAEGTWPVADAELARLLPWLAERAGELPAASVDRLVAARVWLDASGERAHLTALRRGIGAEPVRAFYDATGLRRVAHPATERLVDAARATAALPSASIATVTADLRDVGGEVSLDRGELARLLAAAAEQLPRAELATLWTLPFFCAVGDDARRPLASWAAPDPSACHRPGALRAALSPGALPLLSEADEALFGAFLAAAGPAPASLADALHRARVDPAVAASAGALYDAVAAADPAALDADARHALAALPIFEDRTGARRPAAALAPAARLWEALGADLAGALNLDAALLAPDAEAVVARLELATRPLAELLAGDVLATLRPGDPLATQPPPWASRDALVRLLALCAAEGLAVAGLPLAVDDRGHLATTPLVWASAGTRALARALALYQTVQTLADAAWAEALPAELAEAALRPLAARQVAEALRQRCPEELPRADHPALTDLDALYAWLRDAADALADDEAARGALGSAAVVPAQRGTLRAPRELVLDPTAPDLGLDWGVSPDVPGDVATRLAALYPFDRRQRRAVVAHVLDGLAAAEAAGDAPRAATLIAYLARAVGAGEVSDAELAERVRYSAIRTRLVVPLAGGGFGKGRRAWLGTADEAAGVAAFCVDPPELVALPAGDAATRALLVACGATVELDDELVIACLDGRRRREGPDAALSLARHVAAQALAEPARAARWGLAKRAWVPDGLGRLRHARELVWPDPLARALFADAPERFPDPALTRDLPLAAARALGFARAEELPLEDLAARVGARAATPALLDWLERGLAEGRLVDGAVRAAFRDRLRLADREGTPRRVTELALDGARALFGPWRGDLADAEQVPRLARALGVVERPDDAMVLAFVTEMGARLEAIEGLEDEARRALGDALARCYERLVEALAAGRAVKLPARAAVVGLSGDESVVVRADDPALRLLDPAELVEALPAERLAGWVDPLPTCARTEALAELLASVGVADLWGLFTIGEVVAGPRRDELAGPAEALRAGLASALGAARVGKTARVAEPLTLVGTIEGARARVEVDGVVHGGILWLTPAALSEPELLAVALEPVAARRAAMRRWLREGAWQVAPPRPTPAPAPSRAERGARREDEGPGLMGRIKRWWSRDRAPEATDDEEAQDEPTLTPRPGTRTSAGGGSRGRRPSTADPDEPRPWRMRHEASFAPRDEVVEQLETSDGWMASRLTRPEIGFAFSPTTLPSPWIYAPNLLATRFSRRGQRWEVARLERPTLGRTAGLVVMRGKLGAGDAVLPVPMSAELADVRVEGEVATTLAGPAGERVLRLREAARVDLRVTLGALEGLDEAVVGGDEGALASFVPDEELPAEVLAFVAGVDPDAGALARALTVRDFVRARYRYDPSYLEDPGLGRWLARVTRGRANVHVAALHVAADAEHLGAGVCYELNALTCELLRRVGVPAAIATGWVLTGGALSDPDHLWAVALLRDAAGAPVWVPVDASATRDGRPLTVARRPPVRIPPPRDRRASAPSAPRGLEAGGSRGGGRGGGSSGGGTGRAASGKDRVKPPRQELLRVIHHLERLAGRALSPDDRAELERALTDPDRARALLERL